MTSISPPVVEREITPRIRRIAVGAAIVAVGTSVLGAALSPYLLTHYPALLLALSPEPRHVVLTAGSLSGLEIVPLVVVRRVLGLLALYALGWVYGQAAVGFVEGRSERAGRFLRWVETKLARWGAIVVLILPTPTVVVMAGVAGTAIRQVGPAMLLGHCFWVTLTWLFGDAVLAFTSPLLDFLARHVIAATVICALVVLATQARTWLLRRRRPASVPDEAEPEPPTGE